VSSGEIAAGSFGVQLRRLARRSIARTIRQPIVIVPSFVFPLFMLAIVSAGGDQVTKIKGFPTDSYLTFVLGAMLVQGASSAATMAGGTLGNDIATGFLSRLKLTPMRSSTLLIANLAGVAVIGLAQAIIYLIVGLAFGVSVKAGVAGAIALIGVVFLIILAFGAIGSLAAVATGSGEQVQGLVAVVLALLFMSSMLMPRNLISQDWFKTIATYNPMSYLVEATRSLLITGWDGEALALGCGIALVGLVVPLAAASRRMQRSVM
jgi:ABC-2 type transport system permease protein